MLFVAGGDGSEVLQLVEEALDEVPVAIQEGAEGRLVTRLEIGLTLPRLLPSRREFLRLDKDGKATVVDREQCPLDLSLAKMKARQRFDERRGRGEELDAVRIVDASGLEVLVYREGGDPS